MTEIPDLGLDLQEEPARSADDYFRDEFDRKAFGEETPTYSRLVYGPDPLIDKSPATKAAIEKIGLLDYAEEVYRMILARGAAAMTEPHMRIAVAGAINKFGVESVATAFRKRIHAIPSRTVHYEYDRDVDVEISGSAVMSDTISQYSRPGMAYKFLSPRCIDVLGMRGYEIVKVDGDPVKCGTLILGEIPEWKANERKRRWARESQEKVAEITDSMVGAADRIASEAGAVGKGSGALQPGEVFGPNAGGVESKLDQRRPVGFSVEVSE